LYAKLEKYEFWLEEVLFLGHLATKEVIKVKPHEIKTIIDFLRLMNVIEVRGFLGLVEYYRRFVKNFSKIGFQLTNLLRKVT